MSGEALCLSGPLAAALTSADLPAAVLDQLAAAVRTGEPASALSAALAEVGERLPAFAAYAVEGDRVRLFARGTGSATAVDATGGRHVLDPTAGSALADLLVASAVEVALSAGASVPVRTVHRLVIEAAAAEPPPAAAPSLDELPDPMGTQVFTEHEIAGAAAGASWIPPTRFDGTMTGEYDFAHLIDGAPSGGIEAAAIRSEPGARHEDEDLLVPPSWDVPAPPLPVPPLAAPPSLDGPAPGWTPPSLLGPAPGPDVGAAPGLPLVGSPPPSPPSVPVQPFHVGPELTPPAGESGNGPKVQAVACPEGHLNHPAAPTCRVCGAGIVDRSVVWAHRPSLGRLRFDDGQLIELDRSLVIGRRPSAGGRGGDHGLVTVADPESSISRSHVELIIQDWQMAVTDLGSTNGTVVEAPGEEPVRLRADVPHVVGPGARVVLGGAVAFVIAPPSA